MLPTGDDFEYRTVSMDNLQFECNWPAKKFRMLEFKQYINEFTSSSLKESNLFGRRTLGGVKLKFKLTNVDASQLYDDPKLLFMDIINAIAHDCLPMRKTVYAAIIETEREDWTNKTDDFHEIKNMPKFFGRIKNSVPFSSSRFVDGFVGVEIMWIAQDERDDINFDNDLPQGLKLRPVTIGLLKKRFRRHVSSLQWYRIETIPLFGCYEFAGAKISFNLKNLKKSDAPRLAFLKLIRFFVRRVITTGAIFTLDVQAKSYDFPMIACREDDIFHEMQKILRIPHNLLTTLEGPITILVTYINVIPETV
jgi:hypothetical protein